MSKERRDLALENLALRQQLAVLKRPQRRIRIKQRDRLFWIWLSRTWAGWRAALIIVKPETVVGWHRKVVGQFGLNCNAQAFGIPKGFNLVAVGELATPTDRG